MKQQQYMLKHLNRSINLEIVTNLSKRIKFKYVPYLIQNERCEMKSKEKVVQTTLSPEEHAILLDYATQHEISIKEAVRRAILNLLKSDTIDENDPYFNLQAKSRIKNEKASQEVDQIIYRTG